MRYGRVMGGGSTLISPPARDGPEPQGTTVALLRRAEYAEWAILVADVALVFLALWAINPASLPSALVVVSQNWGLVGFAVIAVVVPAVLIAWERWLVQLVRRGDLALARRWLRPAVWFGFLIWIVPGFYLLEALNVLNSWTSVNAAPPIARFIP